MSMNSMSMNIDNKQIGSFIQTGMILFGLYNYVYKNYINQNKQNYNKSIHTYTLIASRNQLVNKIKMKENDIYLIKKKQDITDSEKQYIIKLIESKKNDLIDKLLDTQYDLYFIDKNHNK